MSARTYRAARRPAPRRVSARTGSATRIDWDRLGRMTLVAVLFVVAVWYVNPLIKLTGQWQEARSDRAELRALQRQNAGLRRRAAELSRPGVLEQEARKIGMVRRGERAYVIRGLER